MQYLSYLLTRGLIGLFALMPFSMLYRLADVLAWFFYKIGYRKAVVYGNLCRCFPEKSAAAIDQIARESYRNLADVTIESIKGASLPLSKLNERYRYRNADLLNDALAQGRSLILTGGHYNNWEWAAITVGQWIHGNAVGVYKPLTNKYLEKYFFDVRSKGGTLLKSMKDTYRAVEQLRGSPSVFILVADQSPSNRKTSQWVQFFNQPTACLPGIDLIAREQNFPVYFYHTERVRRGFYEMTFLPLCLTPQATSTGDINQMMLTMLEQKIREQPAPWLWSHRRWKMSPE